MNKELSRLLASHYTLITPTTRLSRALQYQYALEQARQGKTAWQSPDILPWQGWLQRCWERYALGRQCDQMLLSSHQQQQLWAEIISHSPVSDRLLNGGQAARQALVSWQICQEWQIPVFPGDVYIDEDAYAFQQWCREYQDRCQEHGWVDHALLPDLLSGSGEMLPGNEKLALAGFDEITPQQRRLLEKLAADGSDIREVPLAEANQRVVAYGLVDRRSEISAAAHWAREILAANPDHSIGIVVHNLNALHSQIKNTFEDVMQPGAILDGEVSAAKSFSISLGRPLLEYPLIADAWRILSLGRLSIPTEEFSRVLRSPFIKSASEERPLRALFDEVLRKYSEHSITFNSLRQLLERQDIHPTLVPGDFMACCTSLEKTLQSHVGRRQSTAEWARVFNELLKVFAWPGERPLDSREYQTVNEWQSILEQFAMLDVVSPRLGFQDACTQMRRILVNTRFQPETHEAPVQILGMNGAAGMQFDHLWVMGLHQEAWPGRAEPDVFIPLALQREFGLPGASPENRLSYAGKMLDRLIRSAGDVVLSYPANDKDQVLQPSALIRPYLADEYDGDGQLEGYVRIQFLAGHTETFTDQRARAIPAGEQVRGGTALFRDQAACPFRAFARHRLAARRLETRDIGLSAMDRGSIAHTVMETFWLRMGSLKNLQEKTPSELEDIIGQVVAETVQRYQQKFPFTFTGRFTDLETERLKRLLTELAELEKQRQPFEVRQCEHWHSVTINDIDISTRIDRIDQLLDGRLVVIDYKTGASDPKPGTWIGERPDEPQLPLYAVSSEGAVAAVTFIKLRLGEVACAGLAEEEGLLPGVKTIDKVSAIRDQVRDWPDLLRQWQVTLDKLASDFREGVATVDPKEGKTCTYCDLHSFCRIHELQTVPVSTGEDESQ